MATFLYFVDCVFFVLTTRKRRNDLSFLSNVLQDYTLFFSICCDGKLPTRYHCHDLCNYTSTTVHTYTTSATQFTIMGNAAPHRRRSSLFLKGKMVLTFLTWRRKRLRPKHELMPLTLYTCSVPCNRVPF